MSNFNKFAYIEELEVLKREYLDSDEYDYFCSHLEYDKDLQSLVVDFADAESRKDIVAEQIQEMLVEIQKLSDREFEEFVSRFRFT